MRPLGYRRCVRRLYARRPRSGSHSIDLPRAEGRIDGSSFATMALERVAIKAGQPPSLFSGRLYVRPSCYFNIAENIQGLYSLASHGSDIVA